jgi:hypothetical protein
MEGDVPMVAMPVDGKDLITRVAATHILGTLAIRATEEADLLMLLLVLEGR